MTSPAALRQAHALVATSVRKYGNDSTEAHHARRNLVVLRTVRDLAKVRDEHGEFTTAQLALITSTIK